MPVPLYSNHAEVALAGNHGLIFDKLVDQWAFDPKVEFDKTKWIGKFVKKPVGNSQELNEFAVRYVKLVIAMGGELIGLKNISRFVTGTGLQHPMENGFAWHRTLGVPYLPSSGFKGAIMNACVTEFPGLSTDDRSSSCDWFGSPSAVGQFMFFDLIPVKPTKLCVEILTPHYSDYYLNGNTPGDWINPVPIPFLAVETNQTWIVGVLKTNRNRRLSAAELRKTILDVVNLYGLGAKTAIGMGGFQEDPDIVGILEEKIKTDKANCEKLKAAESLAPEVKPFQLLLENSKDAAQLWQAVRQQVENMLKNGSKLRQTTADWLRQNVIEVKNPGIWDEPDAVSGKQKKPKYNLKLVALTKLIKENTAPDGT